MSTKKIEGYVYENNLPAVGKNRLRDTTVTFFPEEDPNPNHTKATTLIIHFGKSEPVYTQSEVVAMLREIHEKIEGMAEFADEFYTDAARETTARTVRAARRHLQLVATKHGFTL